MGRRRAAALQPGAYKPKAANLDGEGEGGLRRAVRGEYEQAMLGATPAETAAQQKAHDEVKRSSRSSPGSSSASTRRRARTSPGDGGASSVRMEEATPSAWRRGTASEEVYAARKNTAQLANREELSQEEQGAAAAEEAHPQAAGRRARRGGARKLSPGARKRIEARKNEAALADAKRKGTVLEGVVSGGGGSGESGFSR